MRQRFLPGRLEEKQIHMCIKNGPILCPAIESKRIYIYIIITADLGFVSSKDALVEFALHVGVGILKHAY